MLMVHGTGIFTYIWLKFMIHVGKYRGKYTVQTRPMDPENGYTFIRAENDSWFQFWLVMFKEGTDIRALVGLPVLVAGEWNPKPQDSWPIVDQFFEFEVDYPDRFLRS